MSQKSIVLLGATGAVGSEALKALLAIPETGRMTTFGRRHVPGISAERVAQHTIDIFTPSTYMDFLPGHQVAICTLGVVLS